MVFYIQVKTHKKKYRKHYTYSCQLFTQLPQLQREYTPKDSCKLCIQSGSGEIITLLKIYEVLPLTPLTMSFLEYYN